MVIENLVMFSGGACSYIAAKRVIERHGVEGTVLLFADTMIEDPTLYTFIDEASAKLGIQVTKVSDGRTPFEIFKDVRFLGNSRVDPCSRILKRDLLNNWRKEHCDPEVTVTHFGLDFNEPHRLTRVRKLHAPWQVEAYLTSRPVITKEDMLEEIREDGLEPCDLYRHGFSHANCGGGCIKSGIAQFELLLRTHPERFEQWEQAEEMMRQELGRDISILKDRRNTWKPKPLTLRALRERMNCGGQLTFDELSDWGGCGCAVE